MTSLRADHAAPRSGLIGRLVDAMIGQVFGRFALVSLASLVTGHILLYGIHVWMSVDPVPSNIASTTLNTAIVFVANRRLVWNVDGEVSIRREVIPFALLAVLGLLVSTGLVWLVSTTIGEGLWVNAANLTGFGLVWIARFFILDRLIYRELAANQHAS